MHVEIVPNRGSKPAILLRESFREGKKVRKRTLGNISKLPMNQVEAIRRVLKGEQLVSTDELFEIITDGSPAHGNVEAVMTTMRRLRVANLLCSRSSRQRDLVIAMVGARILKPRSKLATSRSWSSTTLSDMLGLGDADEDELYDWLLERQEDIEKKLAARHFTEGDLALYDLTSSYFEGVTCPLAALGHNRDGKKGKLQVNYGLLANDRGIPVAVSVFKGSSGDPTTLLGQVDTLRQHFGIEQFVLVGDRGMIAQKQVAALRAIDGVDWLTALRPEAIRKLVNAGAIQMGLFDERNIFELEHPDWPGERLIACRNPELAQRRSAKREALLEATAAALDTVRRMVGRGRLYGKTTIGDRVGKVLGQYKVGTHYTVEVRDDGFDYTVDEEALAAEVAKGTGTDTARAVQAPHRVHRRQARHGPQENRAGTAARQGRYRRAGRQGRQQVHGGQALRAAHRGRLLHLRGQPRENRRRGRTRRHLCGPHERRETDHGRGPGGPQLQTACQRRARLPLPQERGPDGPTHPTSSQGPGPRPHLPVHARLLRPVAHDRSLAPVALRRRGPGGQSNTGPGGTRQALEDSAAEGAHEAAR